MQARQKLYRWIADQGSRATRALTLAGIMLLASIVGLALVVSARDASAVCPTPGASQQLLVDREAGYCLLYPAEYSLVRTEPDMTDLVIGSVLNHVDPRLSIRVEEAGGRSLEEVRAQMAADFEPAGWGLTSEAITVDGVDAVLLDNLPGQDLNRRVAFLQNGRLYTLFLAPIGDEGSETRQQAEMLYRQVLDSFRFLKPAVSTPPPATDLDAAEPIHFAPRNSSITMSGSVTAQAAKRYLLSALGGQTLDVKLDTSSLEAYITVLTPEGGNMAGADGPIHQWSGQLPVDGDYVVEVINPGHAAVDFELTVTLSEATDVGSGDGSEPVEVLVQLDWEGGFTPPEVAVPFGRVPAFTLLADGRVLYLDWDDTADVFQEKLLITQLRQDETEALLQQVLDMGFARLESHLDFCMALDDGTSQCVADAGYSVLRVRLPEGDLREIRNWAGFANDPQALAAILDLLSNYRHPEAVPFVPVKASLFIRPIPSAEGVKVDDWPLDPGWLTPPAPAVEQWAGVLAGEEWNTLLQRSSWNVGTRYYRHAAQYYQVVLVPWLPGTDYTDAVPAYRSP